MTCDQNNSDVECTYGKSQFGAYDENIGTIQRGPRTDVVLAPSFQHLTFNRGRRCPSGDESDVTYNQTYGMSDDGKPMSRASR